MRAQVQPRGYSRAATHALPHAPFREKIRPIGCTLWAPASPRLASSQRCREGFRSIHQRNFATNVGAASVCVYAVLTGMRSPTGEGPLKAVAPAKRPRRTTARMAETRTIGQKSINPLLFMSSSLDVRRSQDCDPLRPQNFSAAGRVLMLLTTVPRNYQGITAGGRQAREEGAVVLLDASPRSGHSRSVWVRFRHSRRVIGRRCV